MTAKKALEQAVAQLKSSVQSVECHTRRCAKSKGAEGLAMLQLLASFSGRASQVAGLKDEVVDLFGDSRLFDLWVELRALRAQLAAANDELRETRKACPAPKLGQGPPVLEDPNVRRLSRSERLRRFRLEWLLQDRGDAAKAVAVKSSPRRPAGRATPHYLRLVREQAGMKKEMQLVGKVKFKHKRLRLTQRLCTALCME